MAITLGGKSYTLGWTWGAKRRLQEGLKERGVDLNSPDSAVGENLPLVIWAALDKATREGISVDEIEELVNPRNQVEVVTKLGQLFTESEPDREPEGNARAGAVETPTPGDQIHWISSESAPLLSSI